MPDSFRRYMGVYFVVSNHMKHFKSAYGKRKFFMCTPNGMFYYATCLLHTTSLAHWLRRTVGMWLYSNCNMLLWFIQTDNFTAPNRACLLAMNLCRGMKLFLMHIP